MTSRREDRDPNSDKSEDRSPPSDGALGNAMFIVVGFGIATALTGLLTMGLIEFAQSIGWWEVSGQ